MSANKHPDYWRIKAAHLELELARAQAALRVAKAGARFEEVQRSIGLDPNRSYQMDDSTESIAEASLPQ